jgi:predicted metalloprotease
MTHSLYGTSEQRKYWFMKGYKTGDKKGNTLLKLDKKQN